MHSESAWPPSSESCGTQAGWLHENEVQKLFLQVGFPLFVNENATSCTMLKCHSPSRVSLAISTSQQPGVRVNCGVFVMLFMLHVAQPVCESEEPIEVTNGSAPQSLDNLTVVESYPGSTHSKLPLIVTVSCVSAGTFQVAFIVIA
jgi:hypothetical protein